MPLPAPAVVLLWGSGWTVPGAVGRKKVGEQPVHATPLSESQARLSGPCPDRASAPGPLLRPHICPARHTSALHPLSAGLFLLTAAAAGVHCAYTAPVLLAPQLLLSVLSIH